MTVERTSSSSAGALRLLLIGGAHEEEGPLADALGRAGCGAVLRRVATAEEARAALGEAGWDGIVLTDHVRKLLNRKQGPDALRAANRFLDAIVENIPAMIFVKDAGTLSFQRLNRAGEELLGLPRAELLGKNDFDFFPKEEAEFFQAKDMDTLRGRTLIDIPEEPIETKHGLRWLHSRKVPILAEDGEPLYLLGISEDITDRKAAEEELRRAREAAEAASRAKSDFLANVSHELRTPLTSILGFSELVDEGLAGPVLPEQRRFLGEVLSSGRHLLQLVNDLIDLAALDSGRAQMVLSTFDVQAALQASAQIIRGLAEKRGLSTSVAAATALPPLTADEKRFRQILQNLLSNAAKFTPPGGRIELSARATPEDEIEVSVADTGIGIAPEDHERIFGHFEQVETSFSRRLQGAGLGLTLTRRLVEMQGGRVWVESEAGKGSTFRFRLPRAPPPQAKGGEPDPI